MLKVAANKSISKENVLEIEYKILCELDFNMTFPTIFRFLERVQKLVNADALTFNLAHYVSEFSLLFVDF